jgi:D-3-phosphoglycerate dehydrogenase / 2-oxoglutarate reductase
MRRIMRRVVITDCDFGDGEIEREVLGDCYRVCGPHQARTADDVISVGADADALLVQWAPVTREVFDALPNLSVIVRYGVGLDNIDMDAAEHCGVVVRNVDDYCLDEVAAHAFAYITARARRLTELSELVRSGEWGSQLGRDAPGIPSDETVGVAGLGRIGQRVAGHAQSLGFQVLGWDANSEVAVEGVELVGSLLELAEQSDHLSLHVPLTDATRGMVDDPVMRALGPRGHLVNTGRGALIDEDALLAALDSGSLGWASLDVLVTEPPLLGSSGWNLARLDRCTVTPHVAYQSASALDKLRHGAANRVLDQLS